VLWGVIAEEAVDGAARSHGWSAAGPLWRDARGLQVVDGVEASSLRHPKPWQLRDDGSSCLRSGRC